MRKETLEGDLKGAVKLYQQAVNEARSDRATAARALIRMAECYQKLGSAEARAIYERILRDFSDQKDPASEARARLAAISGAPPAGTAVLARQLFSGKLGNDAAISPDGQLLAYPDWSACAFSVKDLSTGATRKVAPFDCEMDYFPGSVFSTDAKHLALGFCHYETKTSKCEIRVVNLDGSGLRTLASPPGMNFPIPYGWTPDNREILVGWDIVASTLFEYGRMIAMIDASSGSIRKVAELPVRQGPGRMRYSLSPDGQWIAYPGWVESPKPHRDVFIISSQGGQPRVAVSSPYDEYPLGFSPDGKSLLVSSNRGAERSALKVQIEAGQPKGEPQSAYTGLPGNQSLGITRAGALVLTADKFDVLSYEADLDPALGKLTSSPRMLRYPLARSMTPLFYLPDGKHAALSASSGAPGEFGRIYVRDLETGFDRAVETQAELGIYKSFSPDSRFAITSGRRTLPSGAKEDGYFLLDLTSGAVKLLLNNYQRKSITLMPHILPDGKNAIFLEHSGRADSFSHKSINLETLEETTIWPDAKESLLSGGAGFSPDGRKIAHRRAFHELHIMNRDGTGDVKIFGDAQAKRGVVNNFTWTKDGQWIYFVRLGDNNRKAAILRIRPEGGETQTIYEGDIKYPNFSLHPSGRRISWVEGRSTQEIWSIDNIARPTN